MQIDHSAGALQLWGGIECTVNRVGDRYFDQIARTGHDRRLDDLDRFAALGLRTLRYPLLWERTMPDDTPDWRWADERLERMRALGITPILGLVHHGSGPPATSLLDPLFPERLARFAQAVAERYPWVTAYTPINEPLTTARFSALYGHWYPHARDAHSFASALLNQCRAVSCAMRAIRAVVPHAQLVQTDDLGNTMSTPQLAYQAAFENERRWVTFDLLCGRVTPDHALWSYFQSIGIEPRALAWFQANPCAPDVIGLNYYLSSERFLDEQLERYPPATHGGNAHEPYADVEAVRIGHVQPVGVVALLQEAWDRYHIPLAITESHNGSTRDEQLRWLRDTWTAAEAARASGADVRAVTVWSLLGGFDWNTLVTREVNNYEPGVFDIRGPAPRPTALASMVHALATGTTPHHPVLASGGWWQRSMRVLYGAPPADDPPMERSYHQHARTPPNQAQPVLITGASGTLGQAFARLCELRGLPYYLLSRQDLDIAERAQAQAVLDQLRPWAVINAAGYVRVDAAESEADRCFRENVAGPACLATLCARHAIPLVTFSSDLVFAGSQHTPYVETSVAAPLNVYGRSKAAAETCVLARHPRALVVRTSAFFGPWDHFNFIAHVREQLALGQPVYADGESVITPTYVPDLVHATLDLLIDGEHGLWHLAHPDALTWAELARRIAAHDGGDAGLIMDQPAAQMGYAAARPRYSALASERGTMLPPLDDALERYWRECQVAVAMPAI